MARESRSINPTQLSAIAAKFISFAVVSLFFAVSSYAEGEETPIPPPVSSEGPLLVRPGVKKGKRREQKETEGTEAPGRFEADTILKSPYHVDGQPLEVDPD